MSERLIISTDVEGTVWNIGENERKRLVEKYVTEVCEYTPPRCIARVTMPYTCVEPFTNQIRALGFEVVQKDEVPPKMGNAQKYIYVYVLKEPERKDEIFANGKKASDYFKK